MSESKSEYEPIQLSHLGPVFDVIESAGYVDANRTDLSDFDKLFGGLSWCISSIKSLDHPLQINTVENIEDALQSMGCPHALKATQIKDLNYVAIYPAVEWIVRLVKTEQSDSSYINERKAAVLKDMQLLKVKIDEAGVDGTVQKLVSLLRISKALGRQGSDFESEYDSKHVRLLSEITKLEKSLNGNDDKDLYDYLDYCVCNLFKELKFAKTELASKLRESVSLKRQLDELPIQVELLQYERRLSELNAHMQDRLRRTRKYYATYNALLEIKDLMLKETSLLNSVDSQFQDSVGNPAGRMKLIDSMESILKGTRQKLEKVQLGLDLEHKTFDALRQRYSAAIANQRSCSVLLKAFQEECRKNERLKEECAKNEKLRSQTSS